MFAEHPDTEVIDTAAPARCVHDSATVPAPRSSQHRLSVFRSFEMRFQRVGIKAVEGSLSGTNSGELVSGSRAPAPRELVVDGIGYCIVCCIV